MNKDVVRNEKEREGMADRRTLSLSIEIPELVEALGLFSHRCLGCRGLCRLDVVARVMVLSSDKDGVRHALG